MKSTLAVVLLLTAGLAPSLAHGQYGNTPIKHVIVIFQENRTPDNLFQGLCTANGGMPGCGTAATKYDIATSYINSAGKKTALLPVGLATNFDLDHSHGGPNLNGTVSGWDFEYTNQGIAAKPGMNVPANCGKDVFGCNVPSNNNSQFMYVYNTPVKNTDGSSGGLMDPYITMATTYGWGNRMFQTNQGPSFPAHQFIFGATSAPTAPDDPAGIFVSENAPGAYGCASGNSVQLIRPNGNTAPPYGTETAGDVTLECFNRNAMDYLFANHTPNPITWTYYSAGQTGLWVAPNSLMNICIPSGTVCTGPDWTKGASNGYVDTAPPDVLTDIGNCALSQVSWVTPAGEYSDHPINSGLGPSWVAAIVNAIGNNKTCDTNGYWKDTAIFITWDDWGGWYDHVLPVFQTGANQDDYQLSFRVPLVVVSAYSTKAGYISNLQYDFGSIVKGIEGIFGLPSLGFADARAANDLHDFFNFNQAATTYKTIPAPRGATFFITNQKLQVSPPDND